MSIIHWLKGVAGSRVSTEVTSDDPLPVTFAAGALIDANPGVAADVVGAIPAAVGRRFLGFVIEETAAVAAAAEIRIRHGGATGPIIAIVKLAADGVATNWFGSNGIAVPDGVTIDHVAGTADVNLFYS